MKLCERSGEPPRLDSSQKATGDEVSSEQMDSDTRNEAVEPKPESGSFMVDAAEGPGKMKHLQLRNVLNVATWNVRTLCQSGKLALLENELKYYKVSICGLAEVRWTGQGHFITNNGNMLIYAGKDSAHSAGVAVWLAGGLAKSVIGYNAMNDRLLSVRIAARPVNLPIIQVYAPAHPATDDELEEFYGQLQELVELTPSTDMLMVQGDFNAKVGKSDTGSPECCGRWGLGVRNEAGDRLVDFATGNGLAIMNTRFQQHSRRLYTWTSPDGQSKNQIDYILAKHRWKTSIRKCRTYPGADCDSDHQLLMAKVQLRLKVLPKPDNLLRFNLDQNTEEFAVQIENRFQALSCLEEESTPDQIWQQMKAALLETAEATLGRRKKQKRKPWISDEVLELAEAKRSLKQQSPTCTSAWWRGEQHKYGNAC